MLRLALILCLGCALGTPNSCVLILPADDAIEAQVSSHVVLHGDRAGGREFTPEVGPVVRVQAACELHLVTAGFLRDPGDGDSAGCFTSDVQVWTWGKA